MRILLAHNSLYYPSHGGGDKSNRILMEALAERGHEIQVVARLGEFSEAAEARFLAALDGRNTQAEVNAGVARFSHNGVRVETLTRNPQMRAAFAAVVRDFDPDVILTSTDDPAQLLFEIAVNAPRARVVHLVRATIAVPFGPDSSMQSERRTGLLRRADAIVGVSEYVARYIREYGRMPAVHVPISLMEPGEPPAVGRFDNSHVTFGNPCAVKGIDIFLGLARCLPNLQFAAVPTWGTNQYDLSRLQSQPNISIVPPVDNMDELFAQTRVLLVPSVWAEARSRIVPEAMLRGVPVMASNIGGIPEAKLGVPYLLPVNPIRGYKPAVDENMVPVAEVPPQDIEPWVAALRRLTTDESHWLAISSASRQAALDYVHNLSVEPFERVLDAVVARPKQMAAAAPRRNALTAEKRRLLAIRMKQRAGRASAGEWFPGIEPAPFRLFCFPHAGGGTLQYRSWREPLIDVAAVVPALLPGREQRIREPAIDDFASLIQKLYEAILPHLSEPFAFFGHSMGAALAFELSRLLRSHSHPMPRALIVSAARAPQFREHWTPPADPSDLEFLDELRRLDGVPDELLEHEEALRVVLPALKADARLYRRYIYRPGPPLGIPIFAYRGRTDPNVRPEHAARWREQTTAAFKEREFDGGHFYLQTCRDELLTALRDDLSTVTP